MTITLADNSHLLAHAQASGFESVEDYVRHVIAEDMQINSGQPAGDRLDRNERQRQFEALLQQAEPANPGLDDSREGICRVRIEQLTSDADSP